jgi:hypothetical protein
MDATKPRLLHRIDADRATLIDFLRDFIRCKSPNPPGDPRDVAAYVRKFLDGHALDHRVIASNEVMPNIVASFDAAAAGRHLALNGHMAGYVRANAMAVAGIDPVPVISLGGTDARLWRYAEIPAIVHGPAPTGMGSTDEHVIVDDFLHVVRCHVLSAYDYMTRPGPAGQQRPEPAPGTYDAATVLPPGSKARRVATAAAFPCSTCWRREGDSNPR